MLKTIKEEGKERVLTPSSIAYQKLSDFLIKKINYLPSRNRYYMSISQQKKFVWFRVAKVGTRTIFDVLKKANVELDAEHPMNCYYPVNVYKDYFKFAFVRNPWDRLVSFWHQKVVEYNYYSFPEDKLTEMRILKNFVEYVATKNIESGDPHLRLQSKLIDLNHIDYLGKFENFNKDLLEIMNILNIKNVPIEKKNASVGRKDYQAYYTKATMERVAEIYRKDIMLFNFNF